MKMPCCSAINCNKRTEKNVRLFRFPKDKRGDKWVQNMRRGNWKPTDSSCLCEKHFEDSQFESHREDGWKKLIPNAIPTLFDIPNPPLMITPLPRKSVYKNPNNSIASSNAKLVNSVSNQIPTTEQVQNDDTPTIL